jgi:Plasmid encoded RepA protein
LRPGSLFGHRSVMAEVHQLIIQYGIEEARRQAVSKHERQVIEAAYQVLSDESERIGYTYSGFALTSLPHKPQTELVWKREGHNLTMLIESGRDRSGAPLGVPYGSYARFILLFLQSEAIRTQSREVELGRSMRVWLATMGISIGGKTYKQVNEQARRISGCSLTFFADRAGAQMKSRGGFVKTEITMSAIDEHQQPALWQDRVILDEDFYRALREHPVPVSDTALRAIGPRSLVIDVYIWLAYRLHALKKDVEISWTALHAQFGAEVGRLRGFRKYFIECLAIAVAAYPDARVDIGDRGLILRPSRPAIAKAS